MGGRGFKPTSLGIYNIFFSAHPPFFSTTTLPYQPKGSQANRAGRALYSVYYYHKKQLIKYTLY